MDEAAGKAKLARATAGWLRGVLFVGLLAGVYVVAVLVSLGVLGLAVALSAASLASGPIGPGGAVPQPTSAQRFDTDAAGYLYVVGFAAVVFILVPALMAGVKTGRVRDSVKLEYLDAPDLWDMVTGLAKDRVIRPPAELRIIAEANAMVTEECRFLGIIPGTRRLYVGLPLLLGLSTGEMRAVICHELGHYARGHTRVGHVVYRGGAAIQEVARKFQPSQRLRFSAAAGLLAVPFLLYARLYLEMTAALRRQQEREADSAAVEAAGKAALAGALQGTYALSLAWSYFLSRHASGAVMARLAPGGLFESFSEMLADEQFQNQITAWRNSPPDTSAPTDSHPSIPARLRDIGLYDADPRNHSQDRAITLLANSEVLLTAAQGLANEELLAATRDRGVLSAADGLQPVPWPEWGRTAAWARATQAAQVLVAAARHTGSTPRPTLSTVLDLLRDEPTASRLKSELTRQPSTDKDAESYLHDALGGLIGCVLVQGRRAEWRLEWAGEGMLTGTDFSAPELSGLVADAVRFPEAVGNLRRYLVDDRSVSVDTPLKPVNQPTARADVTVPARVHASPAPQQEKPRTRRRLRIAVAVAVACAVGVPVTYALTSTTDIPAQFLKDPAAATISDSAIYQMAFSPDGKTLATGDSGGQVDLWNTANWKLTGVLVLTSPVDDGVAAITFSPDSDTLAVGIDSKIYLWNRATAKLAGTLAVPPGGTVTALAYSPDGDTLAAGDDDNGTSGHAYLWDTASRRMTTLRTPDSGLGVGAVAFSPDGKTLAISESDGTSQSMAYLWDVALQEVTTILAALDGSEVDSLAFSPDGKSLAGTFSVFGSMTEKACLWNLNGGGNVIPLDAPGTQGTDAIAFSPDRKTIATGDYNGNAYLWSVATPHVIATLPGSEYDSIFSVAFSPDGKMLATGDGDGNIELWNATW